MARSKVFVPLKLPRSEEERRAFDQKLKEGQVSGNAPVVTVAPTVANFGGGSADAARILKAIKVLHAAFGEDMPSEYRAEVTVPIPVGIVDAVIDILARTAEKAREARAASSQEKRLRRDESANGEDAPFEKRRIFLRRNSTQATMPRSSGPRRRSAS
jgi:hypothetical protein